MKARVFRATLAVALCSALATTVADARKRRTPEVAEGTARAKDGDDIVINGRQIRLNGIDAPEGKQRCALDCKIWNCGSDAKTALDDYLKDRTVTCRKVMDFFGRWIANCDVDGKDLGEWVVRQGWAIDYPDHSKGRYKGAEAEARLGKRGLWQGRFLEPWKCRRVVWPPECKGVFEGCPGEPKQKRFKQK